MLVQSVNGGSQLYYLIDNGSYDPNSPSENTAWTAGPQISEPLFNTVGGNVRIGNGYNSTTEFWQGSLDITRLRIDVAMADSGLWSNWWKAV